MSFIDFLQQHKIVIIVIIILILIAVIVPIVIYTNKSKNDPCLNINCGSHGTWTSGSCVCTDGYTGKNCETDIFCTNNTCSGHGKCTNSFCICKDGWAGKDCSTVSIQCKEDCAINKYCDLTTGTCACKNGSTKDDCSLDCNNACDIIGEVCDTATGNCVPGPCKNNCAGGTCTNQYTGNYQCVCKYGWWQEGCCINRENMCVNPNYGCPSTYPTWPLCKLPSM